MYMVVCCDKCFVTLETTNTSLLKAEKLAIEKDWDLTGDGEFCPSCADKLQKKKEAALRGAATQGDTE
jgi:hypothetical protein